MPDSEFRSAAITEVAAILAAGLQRLSQRKSSQISPVQSETPLDCGAVSGDVCPKKEDFTP